MERSKKKKRKKNIRRSPQMSDSGNLRQNIVRQKCTEQALKHVLCCISPGTLFQLKWHN
jgi:hypothetical protein